MKAGDTKQPIELGECAETNPPGGPRQLGETYSLTVFAAGPDGQDTLERPLGRVIIQPGPVKPGNIAAVRTPDGCLTLRRIYYERAAGGRELVRLEGFTEAAAAQLYELGEVSIEGTVICVCWADEECPYEPGEILT